MSSYNTSYSSDFRPYLYQIVKTAPNGLTQLNRFIIGLATSETFICDRVDDEL